ncbi:unnamed protein product [Symbiodinium microadriaticum]|nr:unnamed protein product [Symbiodinium microadriaticum]
MLHADVTNPPRAPHAGPRKKKIERAPVKKPVGTAIGQASERYVHFGAAFNTELDTAKARVASKDC